MKKIVPIVAIAALAAIVTSCSTSNDVVGGVFQKRKYNKGFYWNRSGGTASSEENNLAQQKKEETIRTANEETVAALDKKELSSNETAFQPASYSHQSNTAATEKAPSTETTNAVKEDRKAPAQPQKAPEQMKKETVLKKNKSVKDVLRKKQYIDSNNSMDDMQILAIIFAILIPPVGVAIYEGITVRFWISLILTLLFFLPGMIYALLVVCGVI